MQQVFQEIIVGIFTWCSICLEYFDFIVLHIKNHIFFVKKSTKSLEFHIYYIVDDHIYFNGISGGIL